MRLLLASLVTAGLGIASLFIPHEVMRLPASETIPQFRWYSLWLSYVRLFAIPLCLALLYWTKGRIAVVWMQLLWGLGFTLFSLAALVEQGPTDVKVHWLMFGCVVFGLAVVVSALPLLRNRKAEK